MKNLKEDWKTTEIAKGLLEHDSWVTRALVVLYQRQTNEEQTNYETITRNGIGFNAPDARFLSGLAKCLLDGKTLSIKQISAARKGLLKYSKQLADVANARARRINNTQSI